MKAGIKIFAPATVANVGVGFDILGFAIDKPGDEIIMRFNDNIKGLKITRITKGKSLPYDIEKNTAGVAAQRFLEHIGETERGIEMEIHKKMPFGSGMGSSAASAAAAVWAANVLFREPLTKQELLPFALAGEQVADGAYHGDNVAPSLLGGMILCRSNKDLDILRLPPFKGLHATVIYPHVQVFTKDSRAVLSDTVSLENAIQQSANLAGLVMSFYKNDISLLQRSLNDVLIEPQRAKLIPHFYAVKEAALKAGALGCTISGAGPSIFALSQNNFVAENVGIAMQKVFEDAKIKSNLYVSTINQEGAILL